MNVGLKTAIDDVIAAHPWPVSVARKRGRSARWPFVPVLRYPTGGPRGLGYSKQVPGRAFATPAEAVECGQAVINRNRELMRTQLADPRHRRYREQFGLPREIG